MRRRIFVTTTAAVAALALLAGCGNGDPAADEPTPIETPTEAPDPEPTDDPEPDPIEFPDLTGVTLTVWSDDTREDGVRQAGEAFTEATGGVVDVVVVDFGDIGPNARTQIPLGEGPDVFLTAHDGLGENVAAGILSPITLGDVEQEFVPEAIAACTFDGQLYCLPIQTENLGLLRNTELAPTAPSTFDEMIAMGEDAGTEFPFLMTVTENGDPFHMYPFQASFGALVFGVAADGEWTTDVAMGGDAGHAFAEWLSEQSDAGIFSTDIGWDQTVAGFGEGNSPFLVSGPWMTGQPGVAELVEAGVITVDPIPTAGGQPATPFFGVQGFHVSSQAENPVAAQLFLTQFLTSQEAQVTFSNASGRAPARADAIALSTAPLIAEFAAAGVGARPMPAIPEMSAVWEFWGVTQSQIVEGGDPITLWDTMIANIEAAIAG